MFLTGSKFYNKNVHFDHHINNGLSNKFRVHFHFDLNSHPLFFIFIFYELQWNENGMFLYWESIEFENCELEAAMLVILFYFSDGFILCVHVYTCDKWNLHKPLLVILWKSLFAHKTLVHSNN